MTEQNTTQPFQLSDSQPEQPIARTVTPILVVAAPDCKSVEKLAARDLLESKEAMTTDIRKEIQESGIFAGKTYMEVMRPIKNESDLQARIDRRPSAPSR
jgi:hypothetical protein